MSENSITLTFASKKDLNRLMRNLEKNKGFVIKNEHLIHGGSIGSFFRDVGHTLAPVGKALRPVAQIARPIAKALLPTIGKLGRWDSNRVTFWCCCW